MKTRFKLICVLCIVISLFTMVVIRTNKAVDAYADTTIKNAVYESINNTIYDYVNKNSESFGNAVKRDYDENGVLVCISLNSALINNIRMGIEKEIVSAVADIGTRDFYIPSGSLIGIKLLAEKGPKIKMKIAPLGTMTSDAINTFESVGINHTLHKVGYEFKIAFRAAAPFSGKDFEAKFTVLICENIIVGKVPNVYFN